MPNCKLARLPILISAALLLCFIAPSVYAAPTYTLSLFAQSTVNYSQPDSVVQWGDHILVGFQNHVAKDGSDGKSSTIVQYSLNGNVERTFSVPGHNDGLRVIGESDLWSLQNEDANPNLVVINLESGQQKEYTFATPVHGGGYDDIRVKDGKVLMTASNPNLNGAGVNIFPALVIATLHGSMVDVEPILKGDAQAEDIPTDARVRLNLTDPDSLAIDPLGNVVLDSQADAELIFIHNLFDDPAVGRLSITLDGAPTTLDDTTFASSVHGFLLFSDVGGDKIYRLDNPNFGLGTAYSTSDTAGIVAILNVHTGVLTPIATGFVSTRGMIFVALGEEEDR